MSPTVEDRKYGPLIFEKRLPRSSAVILTPVALAFLWVALSAGPLTLATVPVLLLALGMLALVGWALSYRARIHEQGVVTESLFGRREMQYRDMRTFAYSRISRAGQVTDTLSLIPRTGKTLRVTVQPRGGQDADLARVVEALTSRGRAQMEQELARTKRARWLTEIQQALPRPPKVSLSREAILLEDAAGSTALPFTAIETRMSNGFFLVIERATGKTRLNVPCLTPNFYPGLALYQCLTQTAPAAALERSPSA